MALALDGRGYSRRTSRVLSPTLITLLLRDSALRLATLLQWYFRPPYTLHRTPNNPLHNTTPYTLHPTSPYTLHSET